MATLEIKREQPKARLITMGQPDQEIEYEEFYPPGTTEPILRKKQPAKPPEEPAPIPVLPPAMGDPPAMVEQKPPATPAESESEYGDGVRINERGEKTLEFGTLNKKAKPAKK